MYQIGERAKCLLSVFLNHEFFRKQNLQVYDFVTFFSLKSEWHYFIFININIMQYPGAHLVFSVSLSVALFGKKKSIIGHEVVTL